MERPTTIVYEELQKSYEYFNQVLFDGQLPACIITLQRKKKSHGYFSPSQFADKEGRTMDEIAMNPQYFITRKIEEVLSTQVHEMVHLWQEHYGKPGRGRYHNKEWVEKMISIGLMPSDTGKPEGAKTGDRISHFIIEEKAYSQACNKLINHKFRLSWY
ncbi:MAG: SprT-like domain-containing protein [gamma proteobacterium symbiont of Lucinoma myriamae]|nr:SprT-like domain-containing protein [gamma proteobacterium symbiont of Lucinoma myriamae]